MNILIPFRWLQENLDTTVNPQKLQELVSLSGPSIERIYDRVGDQVYDIEVTTNRVDALSVRGIAREAAVILSEFGEETQLKPLAAPALNTLFPQAEELPLPKISDPDQLCHRIMTVILANVEHTPTPEWMATRLEQVEIGIHHSAIDITNYVTHELGYPCHAFDYDKIMALGGEIIVTQAKPDQPFTTLDGQHYNTVGGEIVFTNPQGEIIDLPAVKGTANSAVDDQTQRVLFWIESLPPNKVRFASMSHAIRTTAAQLEEKLLDPHLAEPVFTKAISLYQELCNAQLASQVVDIYPQPVVPEPITLPLQRITDYLGLELPTEQIMAILEKLGCQVTQEGEDLKVTPPTFRTDLVIPADLIEEVARIYGYHRLPSQVMATAIPLDKPAQATFQLETQIKHWLSAIGWQELYTYSLVSETEAKQTEFSLSDHLKVSNPLTEDKVYLRRSLIPSLETIMAENSHLAEFSVFEIANVYHPQAGALPIEETHLTLVSSKPFRQVKGDFESLLAKLFVSETVINVLDEVQRPFSQAGSIQVQDKGNIISLGTLGILPSGHTAIDLALCDLQTVVKTHPTYQPLAQTASIVEDMTFTLPEKTAIGPVMTSLKTVSPVINHVTLKAIYQQNFTFTITYTDPERNLQSSDISPIRQQIAKLISHEFTGQLVGELA